MAKLTPEAELEQQLKALHGPSGHAKVTHGIPTPRPLHFTYCQKAPDGAGYYYHSSATPVWLGLPDDPVGPFTTMAHALSVALTTELTNAIEATEQ